LSRRRWIILAGLLAIIVAAWGWKSRTPTNAPKFRTAAAETGTIEAMVSATGTVRPVVQVEVGSQVSGTLQHIFVDYNSKVRAGQVLCQLEPSSFRARVAQGQAAVAKAEATVKEANRALTRARELVRQNYISQAEVEGAEVALEQRQAELKQALAQLQIAQVDLANTTIRAPIDGVVIARSIDLGQTVAASLQAPTLFVIANDLSQMQVETRIDEADIGRITSGLPVSFTVDAFPDVAFEGRVAQVRLEPIVEQGVVTYTTVIRTENPDLKLRPGMTANVSVHVARRDKVLKVPSAALRFRPPMERGSGGGGAFADARLGGTGRGTGAPGTTAGAFRDSGDRPLEGRRSASAPSADAPRVAGVPGRSGQGGRAGTPDPMRKRPTDRGMTPEGDALRPGSVYVLRDGKPVRVAVMTGLTDGAFVEVEADQLEPGDLVIVGLENTARGPAMQPPPGMGGSQFGGGRSGGSGRR
jgi:HlyD family secretion protein